MKIRSLLVISAGMLLSATAFADISATYRVGGDHTMTVSVRDDRTVRMDVAKDTFMLLKGGKSYSVRRDGNRWVAMDLAEMQKMFAGMGGVASDDDDDEGGEISFRDTGRTETVAGYRGKVYEVTDDEGERTEMVLTDHRDIMAITRGMANLGMQAASNMSGEKAPGMELLSSMFPGGNGGMLRQGRDMVLVSVDKTSKPASFYDLPAGTVMESMPAMPAMPGMGAGGAMGLPPGMNREDMEKQMRDAIKQMEQMQRR
ncbi:MAG: hypothetical protein ACK4SX_13005 [Alcanivoracaceae bacterium]